MRKSLVGLAALLASLVFALAEYSRLPSRVAVHWNVHNHVDRYGPKWSVLLMPVIGAIVFPALAYLLPRIDPHHSNYAKHEGSYWIVWNAVMVVIAGVEVFMVGAALGWQSKIEFGVPLLIGLLFLVIGNVMGRFRPNWFIGVRTPWTLSSEEVWRKTHRLAARTFVVAGIAIVAAAFLPYDWTKFASLVVAAVVAALVPTVYSYVEWRREGRPERPLSA
jgi:uncharacterized membrane protein